MIGERAFTPEALPKSIRGLSVRLLVAVWGNGDSHIQYLSNATDWQVRQLPTRALTSDTIEGSFAEISSSMGYKATPQQLEPHLGRLDLRWSIKHAPNLFNTMQSGRQYSLHSLAAASDKWFDDGWQQAHTVKRQRKVEKTAVKKAKAGDISVRAHHNV